MALNILVACGLAREARIAGGEGVVAVAGGGDAALLEAGLEAAARGGATGVLSFGLCGALDPALGVGDWLIGTGVGEHATDPGWTAALLRAACGPGYDPGPQYRAWTPRVVPRIADGVAIAGRFHADGRLVATPAAKAALAADGAVAVDMESHIAARVAARHGLPFAIARVVSDTAGDTLPPAFAVAMKPGGGTSYAAIAASLARYPGQLPAFTLAARAATKAFAELRRRRFALGGRLALPDVGLRAGDVI